MIRFLQDIALPDFTLGNFHKLLLNEMSPYKRYCRYSKVTEIRDFA